MREARSAAAVKHDNIVTIYQVGEAVVEKVGNVPFLAMEYLRGESLEQRRLRERKLPAAEVLRIGQEVARGLAAAHLAGLIHRDVKPANIWLDADAGRVKILDFGLARAVGEESHLTQQGAIVGTPAFMAPEQTDGRTIDGRADLFSLGCVLYALAVGKPPFHGKDVVSTLMAVVTDQPKPPREINPEVPPALSDLLLMLLAKNPDQRPATASEVAGRLQAIERELADPPVALPAEGARRGASSRLRGILAFAAVLAVLLPLMYFSGVIIRFTSNQADVEIVVDDSEMEVTVKENGAVIRDPKGKRVITLTAGGHELEVTVKDAGGVLRTFTKQFTLSRGGTDILKVRQELAKLPAEKKTATPASALVRADPAIPRNIPEEALAWPGGGDPAQAPAELVAILGDGRFRVLDGGCFPAYSPDGKLLAVPGGNAVFVFDARTGEFKRRLLGHTDRVVIVAFSGDGSLLASGSDDRTARVWQTSEWKEIENLKEHPDRVISLAFRPDGHVLAAGCADGSIRLWDARTAGPLDLAKQHTASVWGLAFQPNSKSLASASGGEKGTVRTWDTTNGKLQAVCSATSPSPEPDDDRMRLSFSADGKQLAVGAADAVRLFNPETLVQVRKLSANGSGLTAFTTDGKELLVANHHYPRETAIQTLERWSAVTGQKLAALELTCRGMWSHPALSPDGKMLAMIPGGNTVVHLFDATTGKPRFDVGHVQVVRGVAFSPDGKWLASSGEDETIRIWDLARRRQVRVLTRHTGGVNCVAFSPDGKLLASCSRDQTVRLWRVPTWEIAGALMDGTCAICDLAFSPDGKLLAGAGNDKQVYMWDVARREEVRVLRGFREVVLSVGFGPDGKFAAGSEDSTVRLWDGFVREGAAHPADARAL